MVDGDGGMPGEGSKQLGCTLVRNRCPPSSSMDVDRADRLASEDQRCAQNRPEVVALERPRHDARKSRSRRPRSGGASTMACDDTPSPKAISNPSISGGKFQTATTRNRPAPRSHSSMSPLSAPSRVVASMHDRARGRCRGRVTRPLYVRSRATVRVDRAVSHNGVRSQGRSAFAFWRTMIVAECWLVITICQRRSGWYGSACRTRHTSWSAGLAAHRIVLTRVPGCPGHRRRDRRRRVRLSPCPARCRASPCSRPTSWHPGQRGETSATSGSTRDGPDPSSTS